MKIKVKLSKSIIDFVNSSNEIFFKEWNSQEDVKAFAHLQKLEKIKAKRVKKC